MSQDPYAPPPSGKKSSGAGTVIMIVLGIFAVVGVICIGLCAVGGFALQRGATQLGSFALTLGAQMQSQLAIQQNQEIKDKLGEPLTFGEPTNQDVSLDGANSRANFDFAVTGPKGTATAHVQSSQQGEQFKITALTVNMPDGSVVNVDTSNINFDEMPHDEAMHEHGEEVMESEAVDATE